MKRFLLFFMVSLFLPAWAMEENVPLAVRTYAFSTIGKRKTQEDTYITKMIQHNGVSLHCTGIFDGHSGGAEDGDIVSQLAKNKYFDFFEAHLKEGHEIDACLRYACEQCETLTKENVTEESPFSWCGSTVLTSCYDNNSKKLYLTWVGDSQAAVSNGDTNTLTTTLHRPTQEAEKLRIEAFDEANNTVTKIKNDKLNGWIAVSRALGDHYIKSQAPVFTADTESAEWQGDTGYAIYACDGFWDEANNEEAFEYLRNALRLSHADFYKKYENKYGVTKQDPEDDVLKSDSEEEHEMNLAQRLVYIAVSHKGSQDNTTVIVQLFGNNQLLESDENNEEKSSGINAASTSSSSRSEDSEDSSSSDEQQTDPKHLEQALVRLSHFLLSTQDHNSNDDVVEAKAQEQEEVKIQEQKSDSSSEGVCIPNPLPNLISGQKLREKVLKKVQMQQGQQEAEKTTTECEEWSKQVKEENQQAKEENQKKQTQKIKQSEKPKGNGFFVFLHNNSKIIVGGCLGVIAILYALHCVWKHNEYKIVDFWPSR